MTIQEKMEKGQNGMVNVQTWDAIDGVFQNTEDVEALVWMHVLALDIFRRG